MDMYFPVAGAFLLTASLDKFGYDIASGGALDLLGVYAGFGYGLKLGSFVAWMDAKGGYLASTAAAWDAAEASYGLGAGVDWYARGGFAVGLRYQFIASKGPASPSGNYAYKNSSFFLSAGLGF
jgi:hypothetical protein